MSKRMERLTRIVARALLLVFAWVVSVAQPAMGQSPTSEELHFTLLVEPIEGLTSTFALMPLVGRRVGAFALAFVNPGHGAGLTKPVP